MTDLLLPVDMTRDSRIDSSNGQRKIFSVSIVSLFGIRLGGSDFAFDFFLREKTLLDSLLSHEVEGKHGFGLPDGASGFFEEAVTNVNQKSRRATIVGDDHATVRSQFLRNCVWCCLKLAHGTQIHNQSPFEAISILLAMEKCFDKRRLEQCWSLNTESDAGHDLQLQALQPINVTVLLQIWDVSRDVGQKH